MKFSKTNIDNVIICESKIFTDDRGYFCENFRKDLLENFLGFQVNFSQVNQSRSVKNVIRGLHFQEDPYQQNKLIFVNKGEILDVIVDLRKDSNTFGQHITIHLKENQMKSVFIPIGCAHGFAALKEDNVISYLVDTKHVPDSDSGIKFDDPDLAIDWKINLNQVKISNKDNNLMSFKDFKNLHI